MEEGSLIAFVEWSFSQLSSVVLYHEIIASGLMQFLLRLSIVLVVFIVGYSFIMQMYKSVVLNKGNYIAVLFRLALAIFILVNYPWIFVMVIENVDNFSENLVQSEELTRQIDRIDEMSDFQEEEEEGFWESIFGFGGAIIEYDIMDFFVSLTVIALVVAIMIIFILRTLALTFLLLLGPLAVSCLVSDSLKDYFYGWIKSFVNVLLWPFLLAILVLAHGIIMQEVYYNGLEQTGTFYQFITIAINLLFSVFTVKLMTLIPKMKKGTAGALSPVASMLVMGTLTSMKGRILSGGKTLFKGATSGISNSITGVGGSEGSSPSKVNGISS